MQRCLEVLRHMLSIRTVAQNVQSSIGQMCSKSQGAALPGYIGVWNIKSWCDSKFWSAGWVCRKQCNRSHKNIFYITTSHDHIPKEVSLLLVSMDCLNVHLGYIHDTSKADIVGSEVCRLFWKQKCSPVKAGFRNVCVKKGDCCPPCPNKVCSYSWPC